MNGRDELYSVLDKMILSASGWRGIFAVCGDEESKNPKISSNYRVICGAAAFVFYEYLRNLSSGKPVILLGCDTRPTGDAITEAMISVLLTAGCDVRFAGITAAPEIMAWARSLNMQQSTGFIYISASHNPVGHNGFKFGLTDGGVLAAVESIKLINSFRSFLSENENISKIKRFILSADDIQLKNVYDNAKKYKIDAFNSYLEFCGDVMISGNTAIAKALKYSLSEKPLGIVCDFNGSARTVSIDKKFFTELGFKYEYINGAPGQIVHRIVPEGESLIPCSGLLEEAHSRDSSFVIGYMPDCDGDRGNLVVYDDTLGKARTLEAQEVFALACVAELSHMIWTGALPSKAAVAVNDPTSMRVDRIAWAFGVSVFRAEVGEANVVSLARRLREDGYLVRILGEGSAGGNITHPSAVRDPVNTVLAIAKLLSIGTLNGKPGLFEIWCSLSGQADLYRSDFTLSDIIASLPQFISTPSYSKDALLRITTEDHALLKDRYQKVFLQQWEERKDDLKTRFDLCRWEAIAYNGLDERRNPGSFKEALRGGLKILFFDSEDKPSAYIWMRGSATEPVFRIMADVEVKNNYNAEQMENDLLQWQRCMVMTADKNE